MMASQKPPSNHAEPTTHPIHLVQSRETGDVVPQPQKDGPIQGGKANPFAKSWAHFVAGG